MDASDIHSKANIALWASGATIVAVLISVFGFWQERERALWTINEGQTRIEHELNLVKAADIETARTLEALRSRMKISEDRGQINADRIIRMEGIVDRAFPQGKPRETSIQ